MSQVKINSLEIENTKRVKAVRIMPNEKGLTIMGGNNNQGKTSVLDAIAWALGGNKNKPSEAQRQGSELPPYLKVTLSNGLVVERGGKNSDLKVIDPSGNKSGQSLLDSFVSELALNIPKFMDQSSKEKAKTLLNIIGVGDKLFHLEDQEAKLYSKRKEIGVIEKQKKNYANELEHYEDAPVEPVSASTLIKQQQDILARNGENNRKRQNLAFIEQSNASLHAQLKELTEKVRLSDIDLEDAQKSALDLHDESTDALAQSIADIDETNRKVRVNMERERAIDEANQYGSQYEELTAQIESLRAEKFALLNGAALPLPGLSITDGELTYQGFKWDNMSGSQQLKVATAIVRKLNPDCGFVLLDKLEQFDLVQLQEFGQWLEAEGLQAIATRVSTGDECEIIIEDGYVKGQDNPLLEEIQEEVKETEKPTDNIWG